MWRRSCGWMPRRGAGEAGGRCASRSAARAATACRFSRCCSTSFSTGWTRQRDEARGSARRCDRQLDGARGARSSRSPSATPGMVFPATCWRGSSTCSSRPSRTAWASVWRVSRTIVEAHSGRLWAENRNGGGAAFRFTLPIAEERRRMSVTETDRPIVDDDAPSSRPPRGCFGRAGLRSGRWVGEATFSRSEAGWRRAACSR